MSGNADRDPKIEITPEMIEAGVEQLCRFDPEWGLSHEATVEAIFCAMARLSPVAHRPK